MTATLPDEHGGAAYRAVLERLQARGRFGIRLGLGRTRDLLRRLGDPHHRLHGALIGGTNGKGSTQALVGAALTAAGYRVGQTPKPHLVSYRERIVVDGQSISEDDFSAVLAEVLAVADETARRHGQPTEFEVLTAAAFAWFERAGVELGVIEVGMGGRLDATNVWHGGVSAITNVALDHTEHLGPTVVDIAREKAQIIKRGDARALTGAAEPSRAVIRRRAARVAVPLEIVPPFEVMAMDIDGLRVRVPGTGELRVALLGRHQAANAALAWRILDALAAAGIAHTTGEQRAAAFASVRWPGRLENIRRAGSPDVLLDGAHNAHGVEALAAALADLGNGALGARPAVLIGVLRNHYQPGMLEPLRRSEVLREADIIATTVPGSPMAMGADELSAHWPGARAIEDPAAALSEAVERAAGSGSTVLVCGSLYLVGYVRARLTTPDPA